MGWWTSLKWAASEWTGTGVNLRLVQSLCETWSKRARTRSSADFGLVGQFLASATRVINCFGPAWTRRKIRNQPLGVWFLLLLWIVLPLAFAMAAIGQSI
jgi:hypothetical protein